MSLDPNTYDSAAKTHPTLVARLVGPNNCTMICGMIPIYPGATSPNIMAKTKTEANELAVSQRHNWTTPDKKKHRMKVFMGPKRSAIRPMRARPTQTV